MLYMRGARDHWSRPEDLDALKRDLPAVPNSKFVTIPDATHFVFLDRPERGISSFFLRMPLNFSISHGRAIRLLDIPQCSGI